MGDTARNGSDRLDSWKAIAAYLGRDDRTVRLWEDLRIDVRPDVVTAFDGSGVARRGVPFEALSHRARGGEPITLV